MISSRAKGALLSYIFLVVRNATSILIIPFIIKNVGLSHYGVYSLVMSVVGYLMIIELGLSNTAIRFISKALSNNDNREANENFSTIITLYLIVIVISIIISVFIYNWVPSIFSGSLTLSEIDLLKEAFIYLVLNVVVTLFSNSWTGVIVAHEQFVFIKTLDLSSFLLRTGLVVLALTFGFGVMSIIAIDLVLNTLTALIKVFAVYNTTNVRPRIRLKADITKSILSYGAFVALGVIVNQINWRFDIFLIGALLDSYSVAVFNVGLQFVLSFIALGAGISNVFLPKMVNLTSKGFDSKLVFNELVRIGRLQFYILGFFLVCYIPFGPMFIEMFFGPEFELAYYSSIIVIIPFAYILCFSVSNSVLQALNMHRFKAVVLFFTSIFNIAISILLIPSLGIIGASLSTAVFLLVGELFLVGIYINKKLGLNIVHFYYNLVKPTLVLFCIVFVWFLIEQPVNDWIDILNYSFLICAVYAFSMYMVVMSSEEKQYIKSVCVSFKRFKNS